MPEPVFIAAVALAVAGDSVLVVLAPRVGIGRWRMGVGASGIRVMVAIAIVEAILNRH